MTKEKLLKEIENFPNEFEIDFLIDKAIEIEKIEQGLADSNARRVTSHAEFGKEIETWS